MNTAEKKMFFPRHTLDRVLNSDISNEAKVFYTRIFASQLPEEQEFSEDRWKPLFTVWRGQDCYGLIAATWSEQIVKELLDRQFICQQSSTCSFNIIPHHDHAWGFNHLNVDTEELPKEIKTSDGMLIFPCGDGNDKLT